MKRKIAKKTVVGKRIAKKAVKRKVKVPMKREAFKGSASEKPSGGKSTVSFFAGTRLKPGGLRIYTMNGGKIQAFSKHLACAASGLGLLAKIGIKDSEYKVVEKKLQKQMPTAK